MKDNNYTSIINKSLKKLLNRVLLISLNNPLQFLFILKTITVQKRAALLRNKWEKQGIHIPVFLIISVTNRCNLKCKGCYAQTENRLDGAELTIEEYKNIFVQAKELGISFIILAGGEPLIRREILDLAGGFPEIIFPLFTNGILIDNTIINIFKKNKNIIPVLSLEGYEVNTDERRGKGVFKSLSTVIDNFKKSNILFGTSITVTNANYDTVASSSFVNLLIKSGCRIFFYVEYIPVKKGTEDLIISNEKSQSLLEFTELMKKRFPGVFIAFPGDEEALGGCLAAGRGFAHITPGGNMEPCPFAPYSDTNLRNIPLKEALQSDFLKTIRESHRLLGKGKGGCSLWDNREWVKSLLRINS